MSRVVLSLKIDSSQKVRVVMRSIIRIVVVLLKDRRPDCEHQRRSISLNWRWWILRTGRQRLPNCCCCCSCLGSYRVNIVQRRRGRILRRWWCHFCPLYKWRQRWVQLSIDYALPYSSRFVIGCCTRQEMHENCNKIEQIVDVHFNLLPLLLFSALDCHLEQQQQQHYFTFSRVWSNNFKFLCAYLP